MQTEFIPYEEALALKELGFDDECLAGWVGLSRILVVYARDINNEHLKGENLSAPLWQQAFRWFRETHMLKGDISHADSNGTHKFTIWKWNHDNTIGKWERVPFISSFDTYEQAQLECLKELIKIINNHGT